MSKLHTIPEFADNIPEMSAALRAIKQLVETVAGIRSGASFGAPQVFVQGPMPTEQLRASYKVGDLWIRTTDDKLFYWSGTEWRATT